MADIQREAIRGWRSGWRVVVCGCLRLSTLRSGRDSHCDSRRRLVVDLERHVKAHAKSRYGLSRLQPTGPAVSAMPITPTSFLRQLGTSRFPALDHLLTVHVSQPRK